MKTSNLYYLLYC